MLVVCRGFLSGANRLIKPLLADQLESPQLPWGRAKRVESGLSPTDGGVK